VDDDQNIRELVCIVLKNEGFIVFEASNGRDALKKMTEVNPELCIIDIMMPNMDGFELCRQIRQYYEDMPILMLTAMDDINQKVKGYELGTYDYLTKPFEVVELIIRVKALLRRYKIPSSKIIQIGNLTIDKGNHTINVNNRCIDDIPMKEFELLYKLARARGKILSRGDLIEDIWGYNFKGNERTLDVHVNRLRDRFPPGRCHFKITAVRDLGYRLEVVS